MLSASAQRSSVKLTIGISKVNEDGERIDFLPPFFDLHTALNELAERGYRYYAIEHDKDSDYHHYHLVLVSSVLRRTKTYLNNVSECFNCEVNNIQIQDIGDFTLAVQYLIHKNDFDKFQYDSNKILTNDTKEHLDLILESEVVYAESYSIKDIIDICRSDKPYEEILMSFSNQFLKQNFSLINSLCRHYGKC